MTSLKELTETFQDLKQKYDKIDEQSIRDKKYDLPVMNQKEVDEFLQRKISSSEKRKFLLIQIGRLRINLFSEYYEQIKLAQSKNDLDKALELMNAYAEIAIPFIPIKKPYGVTRQIREWYYEKRIVYPEEFIKQWHTKYESWLQQPRMDEKERKERFEELRVTFYSLYTYSFSEENYPPLTRRRTDHD